MCVCVCALLNKARLCELNTGSNSCLRQAHHVWETEIDIWDGGSLATGTRPVLSRFRPCGRRRGRKPAALNSAAWQVAKCHRHGVKCASLTRACLLASVKALPPPWTSPRFLKQDNQEAFWLSSVFKITFLSQPASLQTFLSPGRLWGKPVVWSSFSLTSWKHLPLLLPTPWGASKFRAKPGALIKQHTLSPSSKRLKSRLIFQL